MIRALKILSPGHRREKRNLSRIPYQGIVLDMGAVDCGAHRFDMCEAAAC